jgi:hypothetical protein
LGNIIVGVFIYIGSELLNEVNFVPNLVLLSQFAILATFMAFFKKHWLFCWVVIRVVVKHH